MFQAQEAWCITSFSLHKLTARRYCVADVLQGQPRARPPAPAPPATPSITMADGTVECQLRIARSLARRLSLSLGWILYSGRSFGRSVSFSLHAPPAAFTGKWPKHNRTLSDSRARSRSQRPNQ